MIFELGAPTRIVVGPGARAQVAPALAALGARTILMVTGRGSERAATLSAELRSRNLSVAPFAVGDEPTVDVARAGVRAAVEAGADAILAFGGGSALDAGKAIAALRTNGGDPLDYLEVVGAGKFLERPSLPLVAVPTTAGTGSEVTKNAVLAVPAKRVKASLRSPLMLPRLAVIDPDLLATAPAAVIASSGLDALSQVIEPFLSVRANPITDALARDGIRRSARSLRPAFQAASSARLVGAPGAGGTDDAVADTLADVRQDLALASLCGGLCLANAGLGAVHGFAAPAGGMFGAPHGAVCAALLPPVLEVNLRALRARARDHPALGRMRELSALLTGAAIGDVQPEDGIAFVGDLVKTLGIPGLGHWGLTAAEIPALVAKAKVASSMRGNPLPLTDRELAEIAERASS